MTRFFYLFPVSIAALFASSLAFADEPTPTAPTEVVDDLASAKELNRKGLGAFEAGDYARALPFFESSRALVPSHANTRNVALCLDGLGRKAEALRFYEDLVRDYGNALNAEERAATDKRIAELRQETVSATPPPKVKSPIAAPVLPVPKKPGRLTAGVFLGYAGGVSLGSEVEAKVTSTCAVNCPQTNGWVAGGRVGFRVGSVFSLELSGGYLQLGSSFQRDMASKYGAANELTVTYRLDQRLVLSGAFGGIGASARFPLSQRLSLIGRLGIAGLSAQVSNFMSGNALGKTGAPADVAIEQERTTVKTASVLVMPEVTMEASIGGVVFGAGLGVFVSTLPGPSYGERRLLPSNPSLCALGAEFSAACAPESRVTSGERSIGAFVVFVPQISARYAF